jgi:hypothetical protein
MTTSRQPKVSTSKAYEWSFTLTTDDGQAWVFSLLHGAWSVSRSRGGAGSAAQPASSEKARREEVRAWKAICNDKFIKPRWGPSMTEDATYLEAQRMASQASSEKALGTCENMTGGAAPHRKTEDCEGWVPAAAASPAAREQGGGGKPRKWTRSSECAQVGHRWATTGLNEPCARCGWSLAKLTLLATRGAPPRKRSPRSR